MISFQARQSYMSGAQQMCHVFTVVLISGMLATWKVSEESTLSTSVKICLQ